MNKKRFYNSETFCGKFVYMSEFKGKRTRNADGWGRQLVDALKSGAEITKESMVELATHPVSTVVATTIALGTIAGCSSDEVTPNHPPEAVTIESITVGKTNAFIDWSDATDPDGDRVSFNVKLNGEMIKSDLDDSEFELNGLEANTEYELEIEATDGKGGVTTVSKSFETEPGLQMGDLVLTSDLTLDEHTPEGTVIGTIEVGGQGSVTSVELAGEGKEHFSLEYNPNDDPAVVKIMLEEMVDADAGQVVNNDTPKKFTLVLQAKDQNGVEFEKEFELEFKDNKDGLETTQFKGDFHIVDTDGTILYDESNIGSIELEYADGVVVGGDSTVNYGDDGYDAQYMLSEYEISNGVGLYENAAYLEAFCALHPDLTPVTSDPFNANYDNHIRNKQKSEQYPDGLEMYADPSADHTLGEELWQQALIEKMAGQVISFGQSQGLPVSIASELAFSTEPGWAFLRGLCSGLLARPRTLEEAKRTAGVIKRIVINNGVDLKNLKPDFSNAPTKVQRIYEILSMPVEDQPK